MGRRCYRQPSCYGHQQLSDAGAEVKASRCPCPPQQQSCKGLRVELRRSLLAAGPPPARVRGLQVLAPLTVPHGEPTG